MGAGVIKRASDLTGSFWFKVGGAETQRTRTVLGPAGRKQGRLVSARRRPLVPRPAGYRHVACGRASRVSGPTLDPSASVGGWFGYVGLKIGSAGVYAPAYRPRDQQARLACGEHVGRPGGGRRRGQEGGEVGGGVIDVLADACGAPALIRVAPAGDGARPACRGAAGGRG